VSRPPLAEDAFGTEAVITLPALGVAQHLVREGDLLELRLGDLVAGVVVRVELSARFR